MIIVIIVQPTKEKKKMLSKTCARRESVNSLASPQLILSSAQPWTGLPFVPQPWKLQTRVRVSSSAHARAFCSFVPPSARSSIRPTICRLLVLCRYSTTANSRGGERCCIPYAYP